jgi:hypothetical protein
MTKLHHQHGKMHGNDRVVLNNEHPHNYYLVGGSGTVSSML